MVKTCIYDRRALKVAAIALLLNCYGIQSGFKYIAMQLLGCSGTL